jgi:hypothetical protein
MKVTITKLMASEFEVELPEKCPGCGADFRSGDLLREVNYIDRSYRTKIVDRDGTSVVEINGDDFGGGDVLIVTGYECFDCDYSLTGQCDPEQVPE